MAYFFSKSFGNAKEDPYWYLGLELQSLEEHLLSSKAQNY
jgi:hypothetical protein